MGRLLGGPELGEARRNPADHGIVQHGRDDDAASPLLLRCLLPSLFPSLLSGPPRDVAVPARVIEMQVQAKDDSAVLRLVPIGIGHGLLEFDGGTQRRSGTREFGPRPVTRQLDQPSAVARQGGLEALDAVLRQPRQPAAFVLRRDAGTTDHVRVQIAAMPFASRTMEPLLEPRPASCDASDPARVGSRTLGALFAQTVSPPAKTGPAWRRCSSFQANAGVGDDLLPDLGFAGDVGGGLGLRAGQGFHALLAIRLPHLGRL